MSLNVEPAVGNFPATGGNATHNIISLVDSRLAFKVKSSNNDHYRVRPVYGFVDGKVRTPEFLKIFHMCSAQVRLSQLLS
ncbi:MSP domain protein [Teladorsagia circumcincta]|uniref:MSP domain protein n=1 Tax=Teladorsagia circumcincta TaxID=45464 RepID=A0A2G9U8Z5_TELCI|nr:MSP domain protein [Teladorsagia circumcincta]